MDFPEDKQEGRPPTLSQLNELGEVMEICNLMELPGSGEDFTWNNKQEGEVNILEKLDHCLENDEWTNIFPMAQVTYLPYLSSDHRPLLLCLNPSSHSHKPMTLNMPLNWFF